MAEMRQATCPRCLKMFPNSKKARRVELCPTCRNTKSKKARAGAIASPVDLYVAIMDLIDKSTISIENSMKAIELVTSEIEEKIVDNQLLEMSA